MNDEDARKGTDDKAGDYSINGWSSANIVLRQAKIT